MTMMFLFSQPLLARLKALELVGKDTWKLLKKKKKGTNQELTTVPYKSQVGDTVLVQHHCSRNLDPR